MRGREDENAAIAAPLFFIFPDIIILFFLFVNYIFSAIIY